MLGWAAVFSVVALLGALFGFAGLAPPATAEVARLIFWVFGAFCAATLLGRVARDALRRHAGPPPEPRQR